MPASRGYWPWFCHQRGIWPKICVLRYNHCMNRQLGTNAIATRTLLTAKCPETRHFRGKDAKLRAQTTVELALVILPFFAILFAIIDYAQIYFYENSLQNALREATRFATAGRIIQKLDTDGNGIYTNINGVTVPVAINDSMGREASRNECIRYWFLSNCIIQIPLSNIMIISASTLPAVPPVTSPGGSTLQGGESTTTNAGVVSTNYTPAVAGPGSASDYVQVYASYTVPTITPIFGVFEGLYTRTTINTTGYPCRVSAIVKNEPALLNFSHNAVYSDEYPTGFPSNNQF